MDPRTFRSVCGRFATGVTVVTVMADGRPYGMTANAFSSVSLDPPLVLVCVNRRSTFHDRAARASAYCINLLSERQQELSDRFSGRLRDVTDRFAGVAWRPGVTGAPIILDCLGHLECRPWAAYDGGDHTIFVGEVVAAALSPDPEVESPLLFFGSAYRAIGGRLAAQH